VAQVPFNSHSYYRNKAKRAARVYMAEARGAEGERRSHYVKLARLSWKTYCGYLRTDHCAADVRRLKLGQITYAEFMSKWDPRKGQSNGN
jgi:hypothetical protein